MSITKEPKCSNELEDLVKIILRNEDLDGKIKVVLNGTSEKGDGYMGDIKFIEVTGKTLKNEKRIYHLALKCGKKDQGLRKNVPVRKVFEHEMNMYKTVIPSLQKYLKKKNQPPMDNVADCYSTMIIEGIEYIALENLKRIGFDLHDRKKPMDKNHYKLTLEAYGKWHATSFAMKAQKKEEFDKISNLECMWQLFCEEEKLNFLLKMEDQIAECLTEHKEFELLKQFKDKYSPCYKNWYDLLTFDEPEGIISHGDCWNNNFLFHYKPEDKLKENPTRVVMLDFQLSRLASPVFDLSYHLYTVASAKDLENLKGLLDIYYRSLAENIRKLGSDPEKLFPYEHLLKHWKKYHLVGLLIAGLVLPVTLVAKEDTVNIEDLGDSLPEMLNKMMSKTKKELDKRMINLVRHAVTYEL